MRCLPSCLSNSGRESGGQDCPFAAPIGSRCQAVYFDGDDDLCIQWGGLLELVDLYVKKHVFADPTWYQKEFVGKSNLTDYVARVSGRSFADNTIPRSGMVSASQMGKIFAGYNIGLDEKITNLFCDTRPALPSEKTVDVMCRAVCAPEDWLFPLRGKISAALEPLTQQGFQVVLPDKRVDQKAYYEEIRRSRICEPIRLWRALLARF